jgi:hypothetical protein
MKHIAIALAVSAAALLGGSKASLTAGAASENSARANPAAQSTDFSSGHRHHWRHHHHGHQHWRHGYYRPYYGSYGYYGAPYYYGGAPIVTFGFGGGWHHHHHH